MELNNFINYQTDEGKSDQSTRTFLEIQVISLFLCVFLQFLLLHEFRRYFYQTYFSHFK